MIERPLSTSRSYEAIDVTELLAPFPLVDGFVLVSIPHTTAGLILCEADREMLQDIELVTEKLFAPFEPFQHHKNNNPNAAAHLMSALLGTRLLVPVEKGALVLGTYQRVLFVELDGPRERMVHLAGLVGSTHQGQD